MNGPMPLPADRLSPSGPGLLGGGAAQGYAYPLTQGLLGAIHGSGLLSGPPQLSTAGNFPAGGSPLAQPNATNWTQVAMGLAGNPHAGPYGAGAGQFPGSFTATNTSSPSNTPQSSLLGSFGSGAIGLLGTLAQNPSLLKDGVSAIQGLLGGGGLDGALGLTAANSAVPALTSASMTPVGTGAVSSVANAAGTQAARELAGAALTESATAAPAALTAADMAPISTGAVTATGNAAGASAAQELAAAGYGNAGAGGSGAAGAAGGSLAGAAGAVAGAALPIALAALMPYNAGFNIGEVDQMMNQLATATKANGGPLNAGSLMNPNGTINQQNATAYGDLETLLGDSPQLFSKSGGTGVFLPTLQALGYGPLFADPQSSAPPVRGASPNVQVRGRVVSK